MEEATERSGAIEVSGRRLAWRSVGTGPPLLLVNGYAATAADWDPQFLSSLARSFEVICPDNRGIGGSEPGEGDGPLTIDAMAADLGALLDALEVERLAVAGWSMGGFIAQRLAMRMPERVAALVLLSTDPGGEAAARADPGAWARLTDHSGTARERATRLISLLFPPDLAPDMDRRFGDLVAAARAELSPTTLRAQEEAMEAWYAEGPTEPGGDPPSVLAVCGTEDVVIPPANSDALAAHWPICRVERFTGGGHAFMAQEPERLADLITSFLGESRAETG